MDQIKIQEGFDLLNIKKQDYPEYNDAIDFSKTFEKRSILKSIDIYTSDSTASKEK